MDICAVAPSVQYLGTPTAANLNPVHPVAQLGTFSEQPWRTSASVIRSSDDGAPSRRAPPVARRGGVRRSHVRLTWHLPPDDDEPGAAAGGIHQLLDSIDFPIATHQTDRSGSGGRRHAHTTTLVGPTSGDHQCRGGSGLLRSGCRSSGLGGRIAPGFAFPPAGESGLITMKRGASSIGVGAGGAEADDCFGYWCYVDGMLTTLCAASAPVVAGPDDHSRASGSRRRQIPTGT
jgi:hypothetical protein